MGECEKRTLKSDGAALAAAPAAPRDPCQLGARTHVSQCGALEELLPGVWEQRVGSR